MHFCFQLFIRTFSLLSLCRFLPFHIFNKSLSICENVIFTDKHTINDRLSRFAKMSIQSYYTMLWYNILVLFSHAHVKCSSVHEKMLLQEQLKVVFIIFIKTKIYSGSHGSTCFLRVIFVQEITGLDTN